MSTHQAGQLGKSDDEQLAYAASRQMAILTHNRADFEELARRYVDSGGRHHGIIIAVRRPPYELAHRVLAILNGVTADEMEDLVRYI